MKQIIPFALLCALATSTAPGAVTDPVGYVTSTLEGNGTFNLMGITLQGSVETTGDIVSVAGSVVTVEDGVADALATGPYLIEVTSGDLNGAAELISSFDATADTLTLAVDLSAGLSAGDTFVVRPAATLGSIFGTGDDVVLSKGDANTADLIFVPVGGGAFDVYYHSEDTVFGSGDWTKVGGGGTGATTPLIYSNAVFVQVKGPDAVDVVISGAVKVTQSIVGIQDDFNYISAVNPAGTSLASSGLADSDGFQKGDANSGDLVYLLNETNPGAYRLFHHTEDTVFGSGNWAEVGGSGDGSTALTSGIIIQKRAANPYNASISAPDLGE